MMKKKLLWELWYLIAVGSVVLFLIVDILIHYTEKKMSFVSEKHQWQLKYYAQEAERIFYQEGVEALSDWVQRLEQTEKTWLAVVSTNVEPKAGDLSTQFIEGFRLGRRVEWKIHLYFKENPIMDLPFADGRHHFLIQLPQRMRPGNYFPFADIFLQVLLPFLLLCFFSFLFYRRVMTPVQKLIGATQELKEGNFNVRINDCLVPKNDEISALVNAFDQMAERTEKLFTNQKQLLSDLSHEVRTPLTRIDMALDMAAKGGQAEQALKRLRYEAAVMRNLVEDTLTLAWLTSDPPKLKAESFDLVELIDVICEDARFEFSECVFSLALPESAMIKSSQRALGQAFENIIRNALRYTAPRKGIAVTLSDTNYEYILIVTDYGPGVPEYFIKKIFRPFFRVSKSCVLPSPYPSNNTPPHQRGFGLGLSLAERHVMSIGGEVDAMNHYSSDSKCVAGLRVVIKIPKNM